MLVSESYNFDEEIYEEGGESETEEDDNESQKFTLLVTNQ